MQMVAWGAFIFSEQPEAQFYWCIFILSQAMYYN